jgi:predicted nucleic acid-binding protein
METREALLDQLYEAYTWVPMPDAVFQRAKQVQAMLTPRGEHRCAGPVDLLVAATAELSGLTLLHYDRDFDAVARATGQPVSWVAAPGSVN